MFYFNHYWVIILITRNPSTSKVTWPEYTSATPYCLNISLQSFTVLSGFKRNSIAFFNQYLVPQFGSPYDLAVAQTTAPPMITTPKMITTATATATATVAHDSSFKTTTYVLIGISVALFGLIIILLAIRCYNNRKNQED